MRKSALWPALSIVRRQEFFSLVVTGPDRKSWLQGLFTADVQAVRPGLGSWSLALTKQGKIVADVVLVENEQQELWIGGLEASLGAFRSYLDAFLIMEDAEFREATGDHAWGFAFGKSAWQRVSELGAAVVASGSVPFLADSAVAWVVEKKDEHACLEKLLATGDAKLISAAADWGRLRLTLGMPLFGTDFSGDDNPHQASLERRAVDWHKGCYLGQEVVCMQEMRGKVKRRLVRLRLASSQAPGAGELVLAEDGTLAGEITSSANDAESVLAFARLKAPYFDGSVPLRVREASAQVLVAENGPST